MLVQRHLRVFASDEELRLYLVFIVLGSSLVTLELLTGGFEDGEAAFRHGSFQAVSIMTTTGFGTADSTAWGPLATMTLLLLMFVGASAGSTGGSIKVIRHLLLFKSSGASSSRPLMWLGRMEIIPVAVLLSRNYWRA